MLLDLNKCLLIFEVNTANFSISFNVIKLIAPFLDSMKYCLNGQRENYIGFICGSVFLSL